MEAIEFEIHALPRMTNTLRVHWRTKANEAKRWKGMVMEECVRLKATKLKWERAKVTLTRCSSKAPDADGLVSGFKNVVDALVSAGVLKDDKMSNIGMPDYRWEPAPQGKGKIKVKVELSQPKGETP